MLTKNLLGVSQDVDPSFNDVVLLLHADGADGSTSFIDSSLKNHVFTKKGNSSVSSAIKKFGEGSLYLDGNITGIYTQPSESFAMGPDDFTIECFVYSTGQADNNSRIVNFGPFWNNNNSWSINFNDFYSGKITLASYKLGAIRLLESTTLTIPSTWYHIAVVRSDGVFKLFVNGILEDTNTSYVGVSLESSSENICCIGGAYDFSQDEDFYGYIDEFRITKGLARYSTDFIPNNHPFETNITTTDPHKDDGVLLMHADGLSNSNLFTDSSSKNNIITTHGTTKITSAQGKFNTSAYFNGSTNSYLAIASTTNFGFNTLDFTIEFWIRMSVVVGPANFVDFRGGEATTINSGIRIAISSGSPKLIVGWSSNDYKIDAGSVIVANRWQHIALTRQSDVWRVFVDGIQKGSIIEQFVLPLTSGLRLGTYDGQASGTLNGYIDELRVTKGVARYTSNFTVPSNPFN